MFEFKDGYFLSHQNIVIYINNKACSISDFANTNNRKNITASEAAKRIMFEYLENHSWNVSVLDDIFSTDINNITNENIIMRKVKLDLGEEEMGKALNWCSEIWDEYFEAKSKYFSSILEKDQEKIL